MVVWLENSSLNLMGDFVGSSCVDRKIPFRLSVADTSESVSIVVVILKLVRLLDIPFGYLILSLASPVCTILYKAEKVCHEEMVKMPLVDLKMLEVRGKRTNVNARYHRSTKVDESKLCDIPVVLRGATPIVKAVSFNIYKDERVVGIVARAARDDGWSYFGVDIGRPSTIWERANVVVDAWSRKGGVKPRQV
ncbi:hypothetical protein Tco_1122922 [Tanacetum coccineum]|uniref:Uncharacterized protein n=1 Tax=Tanacetum coccineum TaxID=301880 RepID=A0ABQ5J1V9_9ASTR